MKYLHILIVSWLSTNVFANDCHQDFSEKGVIDSVSAGKAILYPFNFSSLIDGKDEPELKSENLKIQSQDRIVKLSSHLHSEAKIRKAERIISKPSDTEIKVIYRGPNSGFYVSSNYKQVNGCWFMAGLSHEST